jgi:hypothetical protein
VQITVSKPVDPPDGIAGGVTGSAGFLSTTGGGFLSTTGGGRCCTGGVVFGVVPGPTNVGGTGGFVSAEAIPVDGVATLVVIGSTTGGIRGLNTVEGVAVADGKARGSAVTLASSLDPHHRQATIAAAEITAPIATYSTARTTFAFGGGRPEVGRSAGARITGGMGMGIG